MQSLRSKLIIGLLRNRHLFRFKLKPEIVTESFSVDAFRDRIERASERMEKRNKHIKIEGLNIKGMYSEWIIPPSAPSDKVILYIHGGGFISGSCKSHRMHVTKFAQESGVKALVFDYRLAPEHPYPAALEDSIKAYKWLLDQGYKSDNIVIAGESAGGSLTLSLLLALKARGIKLPNSAVAVSPATDLSYSAPSVIANAKRDIAPMNSWRIWTDYYIGDADIRDPYLSPLYGDHAGLPPLYLLVGTYEIHLDDTVNFARKARQAGVEVHLSIWDKMIHAFPILSPLFPEAKEALSEICDYIKRNLSTQ
jgi:acetyl esterase/lipase